ncbi:MAG: M3 family metallopeptidase [Verrucomicrobiales bacterium]|nr:M3 family metallopeptidase [Verrucomicrobiales bacterium]
MPPLNLPILIGLWLLATAFIPIPSAADPLPTPPVNAPDNPLLVASDLPLGYPRFDRIREEHFLPAYQQAMAEERQEIESLATQTEAPNFTNTLVALQRTGLRLDHVERMFANLNGTLTSPTMQAIEKEMAPKLAAHRDAILLDPRLFSRIDAVYRDRHETSLDAESLRLVEKIHEDFVRAGARLDATGKSRLSAINSELATLHATFTQNVLKERNARAVLVDSPGSLDGLDDAAKATASQAAKAAGHTNQFLLSLLNTTGQPPLSSLRDRTLRQRILEASMARGSGGGEFDNRQLVSRLARLRAERARLLGYPHHAAYQLAVQTAREVAKADALLAQLAKPAVANARREAAAMQALIDDDQAGFPLAAHDWDFYAEKVRQQRYAFDESQLRPYFEMSRVLVDGIFYAATQLYGITFHERTDLPRYHPDTRVFEIRDTDGSTLAFFIVDWYARPTKRGGAWMNSYVSQSALLNRKSIIANHLNVPKPPDGEPTLLTYDEVNTAFHEFGHALHGLFSNVRYPRFSGTSVPRDFVEFPSQVNEMWMTWPTILANYARHYRTGDPIPNDLVQKVQAAQRFNQGFKTTEYLAAALLDMAWHQLGPDDVPSVDGVLAFEAAALARAGVDQVPVPPRYRSTYFSHIFGSSAYSAGYYSYIWSEVIDADSVDWFKANGGLTRENGDRFRKTVLSRGGSADAMDLVRSFLGREPRIEPLLRRRGLEAAP